MTTQDWHQFQAGTPKAYHFTVKNKQNCPINQQCAGGDDDFPPSSSANRRQMENVARDLLKIPGLVDSSFVKHHLSEANRVDQFKEASSKLMNSNKVNEVVEYYNKFLSPNQRRALEVAMEQ